MDEPITHDHLTRQNAELTRECENLRSQHEWFLSQANDALTENGQLRAERDTLKAECDRLREKAGYWDYYQNEFLPAHGCESITCLVVERDQLRSDKAALTSERDRLRKALECIARWHGEFPDTGRRWDDGTPMSYAAAFGSNGERDYMRRVAQAALVQSEPTVDRRP